MSRPEPKPPRWLIITTEDAPTTARILLVKDVMNAIHEPGDYGWVSPVDPKEYIGSVIANFENLHATREGAAAVWMAQLLKEIAERQAELERWNLILHA